MKEGSSGVKNVAPSIEKMLAQKEIADKAEAARLAAQKRKTRQPVCHTQTHSQIGPSLILTTLCTTAPQVARLSAEEKAARLAAMTGNAAAADASKDKRLAAWNKVDAAVDEQEKVRKLYPTRRAIFDRMTVREFGAGEGYWRLFLP